MDVINFALGIIGSILGVLNYFGDRARIVIKIVWDMGRLSDDVIIADGFNGIKFNEDKLNGCIVITNGGKRPIFVSHFHLVNVLTGKRMLTEGLEAAASGQKLSEADPPKRILIPQKFDSSYSMEWYNIRACIVDPLGKEYYSKLVISKPSWGVGEINIWLANYNYLMFRFKKIKTLVLKILKAAIP